MTEPGNDTAAPPLDRFNIRFIALGAFFIFLSLFGAEKLIWNVVGDDSRAFFSEAISRISQVEIDAEEKDAIRQETLTRLSIPPVWGIAFVVIIAPFGVGMLVGLRSLSHISAFLAVLLGAWITLAMTQSFSVIALIASLLYSSLGIPGSITVKKVQKWRKEK
jgi:hypothetical protein